MTVINKVNDDSERYFRDAWRFCFVIQCYQTYLCNYLFYMYFIYFLSDRAYFLSFWSKKKVPWNLHFETVIDFNLELILLDVRCLFGHSAIILKSSLSFTFWNIYSDKWNILKVLVSYSCWIILQFWGEWTCRLVNEG